MDKIPVYEPIIPQKSFDYVIDAMSSNWLSLGKYNKLVSDRLKEIIGVNNVLLTSNGTTACHLMALALKKIKNIESIIVPNNVYVAAWNSLVYEDIKLDAIDADIETWNIDLNSLKRRLDISKNSVVLIVHNMGNTINVPELKKLYPDTIFIEDACESFFGTYSGYKAGSKSVLSSLSFFGNKNITCGEGGAVLTNDNDLFNLMFKLHGQGQSDIRFIHDILGYNYRMTNVQAAILLGQLDNIDFLYNKKKEIFSIYRKLIGNSKDIIFQKKEENTESSNWMFGIRVLKSNYNKAEAFFNKFGIEVRPLFYPITYHKHLKDYIINIDKTVNAEFLNKECIILPSSPKLTLSKQEYIVSILFDYIKTI
jgi:perosamine synthetase